MKKSAYQKLFSITMQHGYFNGLTCKGVDIIPTSECSRLLKAYNLIHRADENAITIYYDSEAFSIDSLKTQAGLKLSFYFLVKDAYFTNYTDSFELNRGNVWYFSNKWNNGYLHDVTASGPMYESILARKTLFSYSNETPIQNLYVKDDSGNTVFNFTPDKEGVQNVEVELRDFPYDTYTLYCNQKEGTGTAVGSRFLTADTFQLSGIRCFADIFIKKDSVYPADYRIVFQPRVAFWKYFFVEKTARKLEEEAAITVEPKDMSAGANAIPEIVFKRTDSEVLPDGTAAIAYESSRPIAVKEKSDIKLKFKSKTLREPLLLPVPSYKTLKLRSTGNQDGTQYYSESFIYL